MECRDVRPLVEAFVTDQLLVETTEMVQAHLGRCPACQAEVDGLRRLRAATRSAVLNAPGLAARPEFLASLGPRLRAEGVRRSRFSRLRGWPVALAASLLLVATSGIGWRQWSTSRFSALLQAAVGDHHFCALTFRLLEPPISLEEAARRFDVTDRALEVVEPSGAALSGGPLRIVERHSCVFDGHRFAHLVLRYKGQVVSVLVTDSVDRGESVWNIGPAAGRPATALPSTDGFQVAAFRRGRHMVFVVSSLGQDDVQEVTRAMDGPMTGALTEG